MKEQILKLRAEGKTYKQIKEELGCSLSTISFHCGEGQKEKSYLRKKENIINKKLGVVKEKLLKPKLKNKWEIKFDAFIESWKNGLISGGRGDKSGHGCVSTRIRKYLFKKYDSKCCLCGWSEINIYTNTIPLEIDHIDGNPMNHKEENLKLLCPNCHSLAKTHSTKKGNGRRYYRELFHKNKNVDMVGIQPTQSNDEVFTEL